MASMIGNGLDWNEPAHTLMFKVKMAQNLLLLFNLFTVLSSQLPSKESHCSQVLDTVANC